MIIIIIIGTMIKTSQRSEFKKEREREREKKK
jgi:hypothetical protein